MVDHAGGNVVEVLEVALFAQRLRIIHHAMAVNHQQAEARSQATQVNRTRIDRARTPGGRVLRLLAHLRQRIEELPQHSETLLLDLFAGETDHGSGPLYL